MLKITQIIRRYFNSKHSKKERKGEKERNKKTEAKTETNKVIDFYPDILIITLNVNDLNTN